MIAVLQNTANKVFPTFLPEKFVTRGKPKYEPMSMVMGEVILKKLRNAADNLQGCLKEMDQLGVEVIYMRLSAMNSLHMPYVIDFCVEAAGKVERTHFANQTGTKTWEEEQQAKYQRQKAAKGQKTSRRKAKPHGPSR